MKMFTVREAAELLGLPPHRVLRYVQRGVIPAHKKGWIWLISQKDLDQVKDRITARDGSREKVRRDD